MQRRNFVRNATIAGVGSIAGLGSAAAQNKNPSAAELGLYENIKELIKNGETDRAFEILEKNDVPYSRSSKTRTSEQGFSTLVVKKGGSQTDLDAFKGTEDEYFVNLSFDLSRSNDFVPRAPIKDAIAIGWSEAAFRPVANSEGWSAESNDDLGPGEEYSSAEDSISSCPVINNKDLQTKGYIVVADSGTGGSRNIEEYISSGQIYCAVTKRSAVDFPVTFYSTLKHNYYLGVPPVGVSYTLGKSAAIAASALGTTGSWEIEDNINYSPD